jgi:hypothetical protein
MENSEKHIAKTNGIRTKILEIFIDDTPLGYFDEYQYQLYIERWYGDVTPIKHSPFCAEFDGRPRGVAPSVVGAKLAGFTRSVDVNWPDPAKSSMQGFRAAGRIRQMVESSDKYAMLSDRNRGAGQMEHSAMWRRGGEFVAVRHAPA